MGIAFTPLGSGSKGNSILVETDDGKFLIDCGFCVKNLRDRLAVTGTSLEEIKAVVITHEHIDHVKAAAMLSDKYGVPIIGHEKTLRFMKNKLVESTGVDANCLLKTALSFSDCSAFGLAGITVIPFKTPHDAVFPVGYRFESGGKAAVYATDIGHVSNEIKDMTSGASLVMFESNYDRFMLIAGRYPPQLKCRIMSDCGHLSNDESAVAVADMVNSGTHNIILGHLSEENNTPECARARALAELNKLGAKEGCDYNLTIALQGVVGEKYHA